MCTVINCTSEKIESNNPLKILISMKQKIFHVGNDMISPEIIFKNTSENDIKLIGPTETVTYCVLEQPDHTKLRMYVAMPTGRDPFDFPK